LKDIYNLINCLCKKNNSPLKLARLSSNKLSSKALCQACNNSLGYPTFPSNSIYKTNGLQQAGLYYKKQLITSLSGSKV
jgi:hypothetical protein